MLVHSFWGKICRCHNANATFNWIPRPLRHHHQRNTKNNMISPSLIRIKKFARYIMRLILFNILRVSLLNNKLYFISFCVCRARCTKKQTRNATFIALREKLDYIYAEKNIKIFIGYTACCWLICIYI